MSSVLESKQKTNSLLSFLCSSCPKCFKTQNHLQKHSKRHSEKILEPRFPCSQCAKLFRTRELTLAHEKNVHREKKLKCSQCERLFSSKKDFQKHDCNQKSRKFEYSCNQCDHKIVNKGKLNAHMRSMHNANYKSYFCNICLKKFVRRFALKQHIKTFHPGDNQLSNLDKFVLFGDNVLNVIIQKDNTDKEYENEHKFVFDDKSLTKDDIIIKSKEFKDSLTQKKVKKNGSEENRYLINLEDNLGKKKPENGNFDRYTTDTDKFIENEDLVNRSNMNESSFTQEAKNMLGDDNLLKPLTQTEIENNIKEDERITGGESEDSMKVIRDMKTCSMAIPQENESLDLKYNWDTEKENGGLLNKMIKCEDIEDIGIKLEEHEEWIKDIDLHKISITMSAKQRCGLDEEMDYEKDDVKSEDGLSLNCPDLSKLPLNDNSVDDKTLAATPDLKSEDIKKEGVKTVRKTKGSYKCLECEKVFCYKPSLIDHKRVHTGEKPYQCDLCEKSFSRISSYTIHKTTHTDERPYQCEICGKGSKIKQSYTNHMRLHQGDERYKCDECEKQCTTKQKLEIHKRLHSAAENTYICAVCGQVFSQSRGLKVHARLHTNEKLHIKTPYKCTVCDKFFKKERGLVIHNAMQHSVRQIGQPLTCLQCGKQFQKQNHLQKHNRRHALAESGSIFPCVKCPKQFMSMELVKMHDKNVHAEKTLQCINCLKRFSANRELRHHKCKTHILKP